MEFINNDIFYSNRSVLIFGDNDPDKLIEIISERLNVNKGDQIVFDPSTGVEQLRIDLRNLFLKPSSSEMRILFVFGADNLNKEQSNTLLKTLEEPPIKGKIILLCENKARILGTILSRTNHIYYSDNKDYDREGILELIKDNDFKSYSRVVKEMEKAEAKNRLIKSIAKLRDEGMSQKVDIYRKMCNTLIRMESTNSSYKLALESLYILDKATK